MFKDVELDSATKIVRFSKVMFGENELSLAKCLNFDFVEDGKGKLTIECDLRSTSKIALNEFIKAVYPILYNSPYEKTHRDNLFAAIKVAYEELYQEFSDKFLTKVPYMLYEHQKEALWIMSGKKANLLAADMGTGKTCIAATFSRIHNIKKTLIICPSVVKWSFYRDLTERFQFNPLHFSILDASKRRELSAFQERFIIVNYDILDKKLDYILREPVGHIILDEVHACKNIHARRTKVVRHIIEQNPNARLTFATGTPVKNHVNDVFSYLKMAAHPLGSNYSLFLREYTSSVNVRGVNKVKGGRNLGQLFSRMSNFMIRYTKAQCLDLPPKVLNKYYFKIDEYREEYDNIVKELVKENKASNLHSNLHSLNIVVAKSKLSGVIDIANMIMEQDRKVVIFSSYSEPLKMLEEHFGDKCVKIDGSVSSFNRDALIRKFQEDDNCKVFLGNMIAAGVGITLVNCSDVIYTNFPFTPSELHQSTDRCYRIGQKNSVSVYYTVAEDSIDELLYDMIASKQADINTLIDKGKEDVDYLSIPDRLYSELIKNYKIENDGKETESNQNNNGDSDGGQRGDAEGESILNTVKA